MPLCSHQIWTPFPFQDVTTSDEYDLPTVYVALAKRLEKEFLPLGDEIVASVRELTDELSGPFCERFNAKMKTTYCLVLSIGYTFDLEERADERHIMLDSAEVLLHAPA